VQAGGGNDYVSAGAGQDSLVGGEGNDSLYAGGGDDTLSGGSGNDQLRGGAGADIIEGGEGTDYLYYNTSSAGVSVNLTTNAVSGGDAEGDIISGFECVYGSNYDDQLVGTDGNNTLYGYEGNDVLIGGAGNDYLYGGAGADRIDGGEGTDTATYLTSTAGIIANLVTQTVSGGEAEGDTIIGIERLYATNHDDILLGDDGANYFYAYAGDDSLVGGAGNDSMYAGDGDDTLRGGEGNDYMRGGAGMDVIDGGDGTDFIYYNTSDAAVVVNLTTQTVSGGHAEGDAISSIESVQGSNYDDILTGTDQYNALYGGAGDDVLTAGGGNDALRGDAGADYLDGGDGWDMAYFQTSASGVNINLEAGTASGGDAEGDTLISIEHLYGSYHADNLIGEGGANTIYGMAGDDHIEGLGGNDYLLGYEGNDVLLGGDGNDVLRGGLGADVLTGGAGADQFRYYGIDYGGDTITDFSHADDVLRFASSVFDNGSGFATVSNYDGTNGGFAHTDAMFVYDDVSGHLFYDADGDGGDAVQLVDIAEVQGDAVESDDIGFV